MSKKAICIGINNYPGTHNDLNGCVNDMDDWSALLSMQFGFDVSKLADGEATADRILAVLSDLIDGATDGDRLVVTFSGHGSYELDGADADEADNYDETMCAHDRNILDDEIRAIIGRLADGAYLTVISDSCHSGTVTRNMLRPPSEEGEVQYPMLARYMPMDNHRQFDTMRVPTRHRFFGSGAGMNHLLLTGCTAVQLSYDAWIDGQFNGAMSANAIKLIKADPEMTYQQFHDKLRGVLPSRVYPQSPQLEGPEALRNRKIFS